MSEFFTSDQNSELIVGLVNAVGTETTRVVELLQERLGLAGYRIKRIKISSDVISLFDTPPPGHESEYERIRRLMKAGNETRRQSGDNSVLALGAAARINEYRIAETGENNLPLPKTVFILDSLKRPEEVDRLRTIYPSGFILVAIHAAEDCRKAHMISNLGMSPSEAQDLIERDREESSDEHGQRLNATFHLADFFVGAGSEQTALRKSVKRMVELWFGNPFHTPTFDEYAMFLAFAAALRSADLSRQVGAVVARNEDILATGANDCPKAGGGLYWPTSELSAGDHWDKAGGRDYTRPEGDSNRAEQLRMIDEIVREATKPENGLDETVLRRVLQKSAIRDLTEFGRVVHAEMEALLSCARNQQSPVDATMYVTTFPCHNCAKHIVAAGIARVVYVEPYAKSKALPFHEDSVELTAAVEKSLAGDEPKKVRFQPFVGIGPRRFFDLFSMQLGSSYNLVRKDKQTGKPLEWEIKSAKLRIQMNTGSYLDSELQACSLLGQLKQR